MESSDLGKQQLALSSAHHSHNYSAVHESLMHDKTLCTWARTHQTLHLCVLLISSGEGNSQDRERKVEVARGERKGSREVEREVIGALPRI